ncbi:unnamed protein product [Arabidopsis lyrata]|nr:unnamed protein product [Arabidopsis lyrata]
MSNNSSQRRILFVLKSLESQNDSALEGKVNDFKISEHEVGMYQNEVGIRIRRRPPTDEKGGAACLNVLTDDKYFKVTDIGLASADPLPMKTYTHEEIEVCLYNAYMDYAREC